MGIAIGPTRLAILSDAGIGLFHDPSDNFLQLLHCGQLSSNAFQFGHDQHAAWVCVLICQVWLVCGGVNWLVLGSNLLLVLTATNPNRKMAMRMIESDHPNELRASSLGKALFTTVHPLFTPCLYSACHRFIHWWL